MDCNALILMLILVVYAQGWSFVLPNDEHLIESSELIFVGTILREVKLTGIERSAQLAQIITVHEVIVVIYN